MLIVLHYVMTGVMAINILAKIRKFIFTSKLSRGIFFKIKNKILYLESY